MSGNYVKFIYTHSNWGNRHLRINPHPETCAIEGAGEYDLIAYQSGFQKNGVNKYSIDFQSVGYKKLLIMTKMKIK